MNENIDKLIDAIKYSNSTNNVILACTIISCIIAIISLIISLVILYLQIKDRLLRKKAIGYLYSFFCSNIYSYSITYYATNNKRT